MDYARVISDLLHRAGRAWNWFHRGLHVFALPLLLLSPGHGPATSAQDATIVDPDFWTT